MEKKTKTNNVFFLNYFVNYSTKNYLIGLKVQSDYPGPALIHKPSHFFDIFNSKLNETK